MSTRSQMIHRMKVMRRENTGRNDSLGQPITRETFPYGDDNMLPCRFWDQEARLIVTEGKIVKVAQQKAIVPYGADVRTNDIITEIYDRRDNRLFENAKYRVDSTHNFPKQCIVLALESAS